MIDRYKSVEAANIKERGIIRATTRGSTKQDMEKRGRPAGSRTTPKPDIPGTRLYYRPKEVAQKCGLGLSTVYEGIYRNEIPSRKVGGAVLVPAAFVEGRVKPNAR